MIENRDLNKRCDINLIISLKNKVNNFRQNLLILLIIKQNLYKYIQKLVTIFHVTMIDI